MSETQRIDFDGCALGTFVAVLAWRERDPITWVDWRLYEVVSISGGDGEPEAPWFETPPGPDGARAETVDLAAAAPVATGYCKWDGCAEYECHRGHHCGPADLGAFLAALRRVYVECARLTASDALAECRRLGWVDDRDGAEWEGGEDNDDGD